MCKAKSSNFTCIAPFPSLVGVHRPAGNSSSWSDIGYGSDADRKIEEKGYSEKIVFSTRMNTGRLLAASKMFESQYPEYTGPEMNIEDIGRAVGHVEVVPVVDGDMESPVSDP